MIHFRRFISVQESTTVTDEVKESTTMMNEVEVPTAIMGKVEGSTMIDVDSFTSFITVVDSSPSS